MFGKVWTTTAPYFKNQKKDLRMNGGEGKRHRASTHNLQQDRQFQPKTRRGEFNWKAGELNLMGP